MFKNLKSRTKEELIDIVRCLDNNLENYAHVVGVQYEMLRELTKDMSVDEVTNLRRDVEKKLMEGCCNGKESKQKRI